MDIINLRLQNHHLIGKKFKDTKETVKQLGAVQAQDYYAVLWSLGIRIENPNDKQIENDLDSGKIIRTHIMRPTWHIVLPENLRWMQELTSPRVKTLMGHYNRKLELDDKLFAESQKLIIDALKNKNYLTRQELKKILNENGIKTDVQRLAHIIMWAELDSLICNGPRRGKQFTYALVDERIPETPQISRDEALDRLTQTYFINHGPAQIKDFSWWSGLTMNDARRGLEIAKSKLLSEDINNKTYYFSENLKPLKVDYPAYILSIFDEYTIAYNDRTDISAENYFSKLLSMGNALTAVVLLDGKVAGTWKREIKKDNVLVKLNILREINKAEKNKLEEAINLYGKFLNLPSELI